mmetsp:Transcript_49091/g.152342  ORF Transcript_49091/g.152342 Transcript_49091/m.152342 type:complete len:226 (-) Transcript_49091:135-812(-)
MPHVLWTDEELAALADPEELQPVSVRDCDVLLPVNHEHGRAHQKHTALVGKPLRHDTRQRPDKILAQLPEGEHRRYNDNAGDLVTDGEGDGRTTAYGSPHDEDAVERPLQHPSHKVQPRDGVLREPVLVARAARAYAVARILHSEDVHLELRAKARAERMALTKVLGIGMEVEDDETRRGILKEQAGYLLLGRCFSHLLLLRTAGPSALQPRNPEQLPREGVLVI